MAKVTAPTAAITSKEENRCFNIANKNGVPNAPIPKKTPSKLRFAPFEVLMSETTAFVAPLMMPAHKPKIKTQIFNTGKEETKAMPSKPPHIPRHEMINKNL